MNTKLLIILVAVFSFSTIFVNANARELTQTPSKKAITQNFSIGSYSWEDKVSDYEWSKEKYADASQGFWWMGIAGIITGGVGLVTWISASAGAAAYLISFGYVNPSNLSLTAYNTYWALMGLASFGASLFFFVGPALTAAGFVLNGIFKKKAGLTFNPIMNGDSAGLAMTMKF